MNGRGKEILLVTGGVRSGKSLFAQKWAEARGTKRLFLATARVLDEEMAQRVLRHKADRGEGWRTVEEPLSAAQAILDHGGTVDVIVMDCITLWISNLMLADRPDGEIFTNVQELVRSLERVPCSIAMVTNEVGWGIVPDSPLGRRFRDFAGIVNQTLAKAADTVVLMTAGIPLIIKGSETRLDSL